MPRRWLILLPAVPLFVVCLVGTRGAAANQATEPSAYGYALAGAAALTLLLRRRAPLAGTAAAALLTAGYLALRQPFGPILFVLPTWAWCLTAVMPLRRALPWLAGALALLVGGAAPRVVDEIGWGGLLVWVTAVAGATAAGAVTGFALAARQRSEAAARAEVARRAVSEERLAMAQDVHDGVGHTLAVLAMHAGVAAHVIDRDPARAKELLSTLAVTARESLDGLRADLDRLRAPAAGTAAARRPEPGLADLPLLLDRMRDGGLRLDAELPDPGPADLPPAVDAAAYRIVQESLTNVLRHAGTTEATVRVRLTDTLRIDVANPPSATRAPLDPGGGTGIAGMRRRAAAVGGSLTAGPAPGGGFAVRAELPRRTVPAPDPGGSR